MNDDATFNGGGTNAKVIADSVSPAGYRVTTMEVTFHRFVLAEFNTHRVFSRNSASSRAIPFRKQVERVMNSPAVPVSFPAEQRGMQGGEELSSSERQDAEYGWIHARNSAVQHAQHLANIGVHKSVVNRILEPFMWHTVIVTATEWDGFWDQRCSELAQPEIKVAAELMREAYNTSEPKYVDFGWWHLPYIDEEEDSPALEKYLNDRGYNTAGFNFSDETLRRGIELVKQVSVARSARVSYLNHDGTRDIAKDVDLYNRLVSADPLHASPLEHVCTPASTGEARAGNVLGNLTGWHQMRHQVENEKRVL